MKEPNALFFICCDLSDMTVAECESADCRGQGLDFLETELSPRAVPQIPLSVLRRVSVHREAGRDITL